MLGEQLPPRSKILALMDRVFAVLTMITMLTEVEVEVVLRP